MFSPLIYQNLSKKLILELFIRDSRFSLIDLYYKNPENLVNLGFTIMVIILFTEGVLGVITQMCHSSEYTDTQKSHLKCKKVATSVKL